MISDPQLRGINNARNQPSLSLNQPVQADNTDLHDMHITEEITQTQESEGVAFDHQHQMEVQTTSVPNPYEN